MRYTLRLFAFTSLAILVLSIGIAQAQTSGAGTNASNRSGMTNAEFQFPNLLAPARPLKRAGFALIPASRNASTGESVFSITPMGESNSQIVKSLNGLMGDLTLLAGPNITITPGTNTLTIGATGLLSSIAHNTTLAGNGTSGSPLGIANLGVGANQLADLAVTAPKLANSAVTAPKIAAGQVVKSLNGLLDNVSFAAGANITITPSGGNTLTVAAPAALTVVAHDGTLSGNGTAVSPLKVATAAEQPFQRTVQVHIPDGELVGESAFIVPSDKRLVIEFSSASGVVSSGQTIFLVEIITSLSGEEVPHFLVPVRVAIGGVGFSDRFVSSQQMVVHADPGTQVRVLVARDEAINSAGLSLTVSGHLVNVP